MKLQFSAEQLIGILKLKSHPEGGYYRETYRSDEFIAHGCLPSRFRGDRPYSTAIYYLLPAGTVSRLHRIASDEVWHFYLGGPFTILELRPHGSSDHVVVGPDVVGGQRLQHVVKAGTWFGAYPNAGTDYALVGCTVAPGFDFAEFEVAKEQELLAKFPREEESIKRLTPDD
ncbi:MAG TPA: cupin domain-containing protein [Terriglobales bacterium]|nr:cupin domain-containing protein [Terriglobales bacterium]